MNPYKGTAHEIRLESCLETQQPCKFERDHMNENSANADSYVCSVGMTFESTE